MGRVSLEQLVWTIDKAVERDQLEARDKIYEAVKRATKDDPTFFAITFNPFNHEILTRKKRKRRKKRNL